MQAIHAYIHFPENLDERLDITNVGAIREIVRDFQMSIDLADCEKGSSLYYSKLNKDKFFDNIKAFGELYTLNIGSYNLETFVNLLFSETDIVAVNEVNDSNCKIVAYNSNISGLEEEIPSILFHVVKKADGLAEPDKHILLNLFNCFFSQNPILLIVDCKGDVKTITIPYVTNFHELDTWFTENRLQRNYNFSDNRHIEHHPQSQINSHSKSPLIGGLGGKQNASNLLKNALGDRRNTKDLINYDEVNLRYIWYEFENDNPQNQYHGYHLVKAVSYEEDTKALEGIEKMSDRLINLINYRRDN